MNGGGNSKGVYNPSNLMLFSYTHNNPVNLVDPDGQETTGEFLNNWAKNVVYEDVKSDRSGILGYSAVFVATVWQYLGAESLSKVADNYYNGRDDVTASDYAWATVDVASAGVGKLAKSAKGAYTALKYRKIEQETVKLYRAVSPEELKDIKKMGEFINRGSAEGKYFTESSASASDYAKQAVKGFGDEPYTTVSTTIKRNLLGDSTIVDGGIPAHVIPDRLLPKLKPIIETTMDLP
jgi:hypothetical protein